MADLLVRLLRLLGVNRAVGYGVLTRLLVALAGPVTILLIATRFSMAQQGFYYTFSSLLALQIFFELGLLTVISQFASHEFAFLCWGERGAVQGDERHRERFLDLLYKGVRWYGVSALFLVLALVPAGWWFLGSRGGEVDFVWRLPWLLAVLAVSCNLLMIPFFAVLTGSGDVVSVNKQQLVAGVASSSAGWLVIALGGGLYAVPATSGMTALTGAAYLLSRRPALLLSVWRRFGSGGESPHRIQWWGEVWPMQWKIALSWISGYFIFYLFTPVLFHYRGAQAAGQMGMSLAVFSGITSISMAWINAHVPEFGRCIALRNYQELDASFRSLLIRSLFVVGALCTLFVGSLLGVRALGLPLGNRFVPTAPLICLGVISVVNHVVFALASYLRAHKQEPFLVNSVVFGILMSVSTLLLGRWSGVTGVSVGYLLLSTFFCLPWATHTFLSKKRAWHDVAT